MLAMYNIMHRFTESHANTVDSMVEALPTLKEWLQKSDASALFSAVNSLSKVNRKLHLSAEIH